MVSLSPVNLNKTVTDFWQCEHCSLGVTAESVSNRSERFQNCRFVMLVKTQFTRIMYAMKTRYSFASVVLLIFVFGCAMFISTLAQGGPGYLRSSHVPPGCLTIERAANFGWNVGFHLQIDGRSVRNVIYGRSYSAWLPPGPHVLTVFKVPATGYTEPTSVTVNIQPGTDHLYQAVWESNLVVLQPAGYWITPGAFWQNHGTGYPGVSRYTGSRY